MQRCRNLRPSGRGGCQSIEPALRLDERQAKAFAELPDMTARDRNALLDEAVDDLIDIDKYRRKASAPKP